MLKQLSIFLLGLFAMFNVLSAQVTVKISDATVNPGATVDVDVTFDNFTDIVLFQYSINWDQSVLSFNSIQNVSTELEQFSAAANIGTPAGGGDPGEIAVSWSKTNTQPESLPSDTRLFTIRFNAIGAACDDSDVVLSNSPAVIEFVNDNSQDVGAVANNGNVSINGTDCGGGGGTLTITAPNVSADFGTNLCVPITVTDFTEIQSMTLGFGFDPAVISYTGIQNVSLPGFDEGQINAANADQGELAMLWFDQTGNSPVTLNGTLMELCFDAVGTPGQVSPLEFINPGNTEIDFSNADDQSVPFIVDNGSFTITGMGGSTDFTLIAGDEFIPSGSTACVPISVRNFDNIQSMQFAIMWDSDIVTFTGTSNLNLAQLNENSFNQTSANKLRVTWNNLTGGTSIPDNQTIFEVCFEGSTNCDATSPIMFTNDPPFAIEVSNGNNDIVPVAFISGSGIVDCGCSINLLSLVSPSCNGATDGSINVNVGGMSVSCVWKDASGAIIQQDANCDLVNVGAGTYTLEISDGSTCTESQSFTLVEPNAIIFGGSKLNEEEGCDGSITLQMSGGTAPFSFEWDNGSTANALTDLCAGEYCVTVTDANNCTANTCFTIQPAGISIIETSITDVRCFGGSDGGINITVSGGTPAYTFAWEGPSGNFTTEDIANVMAGNYTVTITDSATPENSLIQNFVIQQPDEITIGASITPSDGDNGSIDISVNGGTAPYTFFWNPGGQSSEDITGLEPGKYTVMVTDANGCTVTSQEFMVNATFIILNIETELSVSCFGLTDAVIDGEIIGGSGVFKYYLDGVEVSYPVTDLAPGSYIFSVEDDQGVMESANIEVSEPDELLIEIVEASECSKGEDGFITVAVTGGTGDYTYVWNVAGSGPGIQGIPAGLYSILVTDENGCTVSLEGIEMDDCNPPVPCYTATSVITPNGDEFNHEFIIACADDVENELKIFNRWGVLVYETSNYDNSWTGTTNGTEELPEGGYYWILEITNGDGTKELQRGTVSILRDKF